MPVEAVLDETPSGVEQLPVKQEQSEASVEVFSRRLMVADCNNNGIPLVQNTYDTTMLELPSTNDFPVGQLTQSIATTYFFSDETEATTTQKFQYDQRGQEIANSLQIAVPTSWNLTTPLPTYQKTQGYNTANQPTTTQTTVNGQPGYTFTQAYQSTAGTLIGLSPTSSGVANLVRQNYNEHGLVGTLEYAADDGAWMATSSFVYDGNLRPITSTATWQPASGSTGSIFESARSYDPVGNVITTSMTHGAIDGVSGSGGSETSNFCYDVRNRLLWGGNSGTQPAAGEGVCGTATKASSFVGANYANAYTYTNLGQVWQGPLEGVGSYQYLYCDSARPHQLSGVYLNGTTCANRGSATPLYEAGYDDWGNQIWREYEGVYADLYYDPLDRLAQWDAGTDGQEWYIYDAQGQRVAQRSISGGITSLTSYVFGIEEYRYDGTGQATSETHYYLLEQRLVGQFDGSTYRYHLTDAQSSVLATFDNIAGSALLLGNGLYEPYGTERYQKGEMGTNKGYTGQYKDQTTGLMYYNARYYDPVVAKFATADIVQDNFHGYDPYAYVGGNPISRIDPLGYFWAELGAGLAFAGLLIATVAVSPLVAGTAAVVLATIGITLAVGTLLGGAAYLLTTKPDQWNGESLGHAMTWGGIGAVLGTLVGFIAGLSALYAGVLGAIIGTGANIFQSITAPPKKDTCDSSIYNCVPAPSGCGESWDCYPKGSAGASQQSTSTAQSSSGWSSDTQYYDYSNSYYGAYYTVGYGDNLRSIAAWFYGDESLWPQIYWNNQWTIGSNPDLIYHGQQLFIP